MREILFRGKRFDNGKWIEGNHSAEDYNPMSCEIEHIARIQQIGSCASYGIFPDTIGQYTGLTDKNGVKIFEGDIVHVHDMTLQCTKPYHEFDGYVDYADGSFRIVTDSAIHYRWIDYELEVIGNIHDNPELIGGKSDGI